ncbi:orphan sodium- and chloride-dependent neurotransmitter transporter NTT5-like [Dasypus novemcinctus]|uniref:orphan sodium- and chloride-dependent neurotransmitter transporter NTT5-like n=1 Tax=Dasypus novemcinctus TaxID=9361 RepID=UPI00265F96D8|nr:orphan sodium- and chloride-dependent neurotransmitter transporter NTT5-like [Dasypus novemcinctus]
MGPVEDVVDLPEERYSSELLSLKSLGSRPLAQDTPTTKTRTYFTQTKKKEYILVQVAFSAGLASIWRFPYLCHRNGGGKAGGPGGCPLKALGGWEPGPGLRVEEPAGQRTRGDGPPGGRPSALPSPGPFILVYSLALLLLGTPLLYMEIVLGQLLRMDNSRVWPRLLPYLGGVGYASLLVCSLVSLYNSAVASWSLSYLCHSFSYHLPWNHCPPGRRPNSTDLSCLQTVPPQYFWYNTVLRASGGVEEGAESVLLSLGLGVLAAWLCVCLVLITGLKLSTPMLVVLSFFPSVILCCLFLRCLLLEGAGASLKRVVTVELSALASLDLWRQAGGHVLYSLSLGMGTVINFSSKVRGNSSVQTAFWVALVNLLTSMLAAATVFLVLGYWTSTSGHACVEKSVSTLKNLVAKGVLPEGAQPPENILLLPALHYLHWIDRLPQDLQHQIVRFSPPCSIKAQKEKFMDGPGLALVAFSQAVSLFPGAPFWTIIFFLALLVTGLSTLLKISEGVVLPLQAAIPASRKHPTLLSVIVCVGGFLGSLVFTSRPGNYILSVFDDHLVPLTLCVIVTVQNAGLAWIYGAKRFMEEMSREQGRILWPVFTFLWCYVALPGLLAVLVISLIQLSQRVPPYYVAWNASAVRRASLHARSGGTTSSRAWAPAPSAWGSPCLNPTPRPLLCPQSQEVQQPYLRSTLCWLSLLAALTLLPIPAHPLHQWWYFQDPIIPEPLEKQLPFKKLPPMSPKSLPWPKQPLKNANFMAQEKTSDSSVRGLTLHPWQCGGPVHREGSQTSSWFSLPLMSSVTSGLSLRSVSLPPSRQVSPASRTPGSGNLQAEAAEGSPAGKPTG